MPDLAMLDYFYGDEAEQFTFYRIPKVLFTDPSYRRISSDAKILYGLMLDRMGLSVRNGWLDEYNRVFIFFTLEDALEYLCCGHTKAVSLFGELDKAGLIERKKQGQGKPTKIYVKNFVRNAEVLTSEKRKSKVPQSGSQDFQKTASNNTEIKDTELSDTEPSIHPARGLPEDKSPAADAMDTMRVYRQIIMENIEYDITRRQLGYDADILDEIVDIMVDTVCSTKPMIRIGGQDFPLEVVKSRLLKLNSEHISYVVSSLKSNTTKVRNIRAYLHTTDDLLFLDPENEYTSLCQQLSGQVIRLAPDSHDYINPLDVDLTTNTGENPLLMKADFIMSFCELILSAAQGGLKPIEKSVIDRCIPKIYRQLIKDPRPENMPILGDLYECLRAQQEEQAQELATALELYVFGSLNYLNHRTNVNVDNRVACYDISGLGQNLKKPGMLTVQNNIWQRTIVNRYAGKTTRIYLDEFHLLLKEPQTAAYTAEIYKRFRKWNGIPTSLTQNVKDLLESPEIENILENSDFILMLNQAASDRNILAQRLGISPQELGHITNSDAGEGLLFFGDKIIPFVDKFPTDTKLYQVMTTKPADLAA